MQVQFGQTLMPSDPLSPIARRQTADVNLLYRTLTDALAVSLERSTQPGGLLTAAGKAAIMREIDHSLDVIFGRYQGDPDAALRTIVERDTALARLAPLDEAVQEMRKAMPKDLRDLVESEART
jgi:hypothetical protein